MQKSVPDVRTNTEKLHDVLQNVLRKVNIDYIYSPGGYTPRFPYVKSTSNVFGEYFRLMGDVDEFGNELERILKTDLPGHKFSFKPDYISNKADNNGIFCLLFQGINCDLIISSGFEYNEKIIEVFVVTCEFILKQKDGKKICAVS